MELFFKNLYAGQFRIPGSALCVLVCVLCMGNVAKMPPDEGEVLARRYCGSCHLYPDPALLPADIWETTVLPNMAARLGIPAPDFNPYRGMTTDEMMLVMRMSIFPEKPILPESDWLKIKNFYLKKAPQKLNLAPPKVQADTLPGFEAKVLPFQKGKYPAVTYVGMDPKDGALRVADKRKNLFRLDNGLMTDSAKMESPVVDIKFQGDTTWLLTIGVMEPNDQKSGSLWQQSPLKTTQVQKNLLRPVHLSMGDLNNDRREDLVVCQHGNYTGRLSWFENTPQGTYKEHLLRQFPGARLTQLVDWNRDGKTDILSLFAQGMEGAWVFINQGNGKFEEQKLLEFPPVYGSSYLEAVDLTGDGWLDLVYTNGDNADLSPILKPYHGVRLYINDGKGRLKERWFYPMHGASKALARDFDGDGDIDLAAIAYFNDPAQNQGFLYFQNQGGFYYKTYSTPQGRLGKWLVMDCGDIDHNGSLDIVIGSLIQRSLGNFAVDPKNPPPSIVIFEQRDRTH